MIEPAIPFRPVGAMLAGHAAAHGGRTAIFDLDRGIGVDFAALAEWVDRIAALLEARGVGRGDRVAVLSADRLEKLLVFLAVWRAGAVACPFHAETSAAHLRAILGYIAPKLALWHPSVDGAALLDGLGVPALRFADWPDGGAGSGGGEELFAALREAGAGRPAGDYGPEDPACIFATSGTTDRPKCVEWDHRGLWLCGLSSIDFAGLTGEDRLLEYRTFSWLSPQILALMPHVQTGLGLYAASRFSRRRFFDWIARHRITVAVGVPAVVNMLLDRPVDVDRARIGALRLMTSSSAPLAEESWRRFEEVYGIRLLQFYGASEGGWLCGNRAHARRIGTVGRPARHMEFAILGPGGAPCPAGAEGEIAMRGPQTAVGGFDPDGRYRDRRPCRLVEWMRTGDLGVADGDGFVTVTGRVKDLIIRGGVNIAPLEIDAVLAAHPSLAEGAAVGVPDPIYGEEVAAFVVARAGESVRPEDVIAHCARRLPESKTPKSVRLVDALPRSERGKIRRDALKAAWREAAPG